jgi:hypothetical protein
LHGAGLFFADIKVKVFLEKELLRDGSPLAGEVAVVRVVLVARGR